MKNFTIIVLLMVIIILYGKMRTFEDQMHQYRAIALEATYIADEAYQMIWEKCEPEKIAL